MTKETSPDRPPQGGGDPWGAFGYLVAGVAFYGVLGWLVGRWLHADYLAAVGIVVGAGFGLYLVIKRLPRIPPPPDDRRRSVPPPDAGGRAAGHIDDDRGDE